MLFVSSSRSALRGSLGIIAARSWLLVTAAHCGAAAHCGGRVGDTAAIDSLIRRGGGGAAAAATAAAAAGVDGTIVADGVGTKFITGKVRRPRSLRTVRIVTAGCMMEMRRNRVTTRGYDDNAHNRARRPTMRITVLAARQCA